MNYFMKLSRVCSDDDTTVGVLTFQDFKCFIVEDQYQPKKVYGETRVPAGIYEILLRTEGGFHSRYNKLFSNHVGMLWLQDIPGFTWVYFHIGNDDDDTDACLLPNTKFNFDTMKGVGSKTAYLKLYKLIAPLLLNKHKVFIVIEDNDNVL